MGPPWIDEFENSVQDRSESGRLCLLKDCECPFRTAARSASPYRIEYGLQPTVCME
jgi:hypothetical protein